MDRLIEMVYAICQLRVESIEPKFSAVCQFTNDSVLGGLKSQSYNWEQIYFKAKGTSLYYVRVFWDFFEPPTHLRKDIFTI